MNNKVSEENQIKYANLLFFTIICVALCANIFVSLIESKGLSLPIVPNLLISQMIILIPGLMFFLLINKGEEPKKLYRRIHPSSFFLLFVFTWLMMPLVTAANVFSQIFTTNEVLGISGEVLDIPMIPMVLIMGIFGPFSEEFVFRGIIYNTFARKSGRYIASGLVSALFFGLMHMNLNQFCYAFVLGIVFALINEILESTWPSFICHAVVNTQNVLMLYLANKIMMMAGETDLLEAYNESQNAMSAASGMATKVMFIVGFLILLCVSMVTTGIAGLLLYGIAALEGREQRFKMIFNISKNKASETTDATNSDMEMVEPTEADVNNKKEKILYPVGMAAIGICIFIIFLLEPLINLLK